MKLPNKPGCRFPGLGGNEGFPEIIDYDSRRTGNGSLDAGSTPAYSTLNTWKTVDRTLESEYSSIRLKTIAKPMRKSSNCFDELVKRAADGGIAAEGWMVNGLSRTTWNISRSWRETGSVIKPACMIVHEKWTFSQFEWHRDNMIYYRLKHMLETVFCITEFGCQKVLGKFGIVRLHKRNC